MSSFIENSIAKFCYTFKQSFASKSAYSICMGKEDINQILARNLATAARAKFDEVNQSALARASKVPQTTVGLILNPDRRVPLKSGEMPSPTLSKVSALAATLELEVWELLHPDLERARRQEEFYKRVEQDFKEAPPTGKAPPAQILPIGRRINLSRTPGRRHDDKVDIPSGTFPMSTNRVRQVMVFGRGMGGLPDRIWTDEDKPTGYSDQYAEIATSDENAFLLPVEGVSMSPKYIQGHFALVEPNTTPEVGDDVLVRFQGGETVLKKLAVRRNGTIELESYNDPVPIIKKEEDIVWMYYVAHPVPKKKIKSR